MTGDDIRAIAWPLLVICILLLIAAVGPGMRR